jgi:hypothetical protein
MWPDLSPPVIPETAKPATRRDSKRLSKADSVRQGIDQTIKGRQRGPAVLPDTSNETVLPARRGWGPRDDPQRLSYLRESPTGSDST